ncbi:MAG: transporter [Cyanobacteriota bacterium]
MTQTTMSLGLAFSHWAVFITILFPTIAAAQQDGPRGYMLSPEGLHGLILTNYAIQANQSPDEDLVLLNSNVTTYLSVPQYAHPLKVFGNFGSLFLAQPAGYVSGRVKIGQQTFANTSSGFGDTAFGAMVGLVGMPALPVDQYIAYKPGFSLSAVATAVAPTGEYDQINIFNLGTNRWMFRAALPMSYSLGTSFLDPSLTTFEVMPAVTFATTNNEPFGADKQTQDPLYQVEVHITRNLNSRLWVSADAAYFYGAKTFTNGIDDQNTRMSFNLGGTAAYNLSAATQLRLSYAHSLFSNDYGFQGQGFRLMLVGGF